MWLVAMWDRLVWLVAIFGVSSGAMVAAKRGRGDVRDCGAVSDRAREGRARGLLGVEPRAGPPRFRGTGNCAGRERDD